MDAVVTRPAGDVNIPVPFPGDYGCCDPLEPNEFLGGYRQRIEVRYRPDMTDEKRAFDASFVDRPRLYFERLAVDLRVCDPVQRVGIGGRKQIRRGFELRVGTPASERGRIRLNAV